MKSYFVFLSRHKLYTAIQAVGLIISIAFIILIGNYVWQQYTIAYSNENIDRVYVVGSNIEASLSTSDKDELVSKLPVIEAASRMEIYGFIVLFEEGAIETSAIYVDPDFFEIFPEFEIIAGNKSDFISGKSCVISETFAKKYFQDRNPVGENLPGYKDLKIAGIYSLSCPSIVREADIIRFMSDEPAENPFKSIGNTLTFIKVPRNYDRNKLLEEVTKVERPHYNENWVEEFTLLTLPELYFGNQFQLKRGDNRMMHILLGVVILLLLSSFINYVNLSLALSGARLKEMATRRLMGSSRKGIIFKNILESIIFIFGCAVVGIALAYIFRPLIDNLLINVSIDTPKDVWRTQHLEIRWTVASVFIVLGFLLLLGICAGISPALLSVKQKPLDIVKGNQRVINKRLFGKGFIILQNIISIMLISLSIVMESQLNHIYQRPFHSREKNVFMIHNFFEKYDDPAHLFSNIKSIPGVQKVGLGSGYPGMIYNFTRISFDDNQDIRSNEVGGMVGVMVGDKDYFDIMHLEFIDVKSENGTSIIYISDLLSNYFKNEGIDPENYFAHNYFNRREISSYGGVYTDVTRKPVTVTNEPGPYSAFVLTTPENLNYSNSILVLVDEESPEIKEAIMNAFYEHTIEKYGYKMEPQESGFITELREETLVSVKSTIVLLEIFMGLSVMISLLGLIAMSTYYANENTKGIAIRKVLGSDVKGETWRNIRLYMILVLVAIAIAVPLSIVISKEYLSRFAYRIDNYWWIFIVASVGSLLIAFLSVYWQISRSAHVNPATELKKE